MTRPDAARINEAMQPGIPRFRRDWQRISAGECEYTYGECPICGASGVRENLTVGDDNDLEIWKCEECGCEWELDIDTAYRFGRVLPQD